MAVNEKRLLMLLFAVASFVAFGWMVYSGFERIKEADASMDAYSKAAARLPASRSHAADAALDEDEMDNRIAWIRAALASRPDPAKTSSFSDFARGVRSVLASYGLAAQQYQVVGTQGAESLEISLNCGTLAFLRFLKEASDEKRGWNIEYMAIRPVIDGDISAITVRIGDAD